MWGQKPTCLLWSFSELPGRSCDTGSAVPVCVAVTGEVCPGAQKEAGMWVSIPTQPLGRVLVANLTSPSAHTGDINSPTVHTA